jgi:hypothetical protein
MSSQPDNFEFVRTAITQIFSRPRRPEVPLPFPWYLKDGVSLINAEGGTMFNRNDSDVRKLLDAIGGEPLTDSGFESEIPEQDFADEEDE